MCLDRDTIKDKMVTLQSNGIIRDETHTIIGRLVEDVDFLCEKFYEKGKQSVYKKLIIEIQRLMENKNI